MADEALIEEIGKFQKLQKDGNSGNLKQKNDKTCEDYELRSMSNTSSMRQTRKRTRSFALKETDKSTPRGNAEDNSVAPGSAARNLCRDFHG